MSCVFGIGDIQLIVSLRMSVIPELTSGNSSVISVRDIGVNNTVSPSLTFAILVLQEDQLLRSYSQVLLFSIMSIFYKLYIPIQ